MTIQQTPLDTHLAPPTVTATGSLGSWQALTGSPKKDIVMYLRIANAPTGTTPSVTIKLQGGPDGTNWADIPSGAFAAQTAATAAGVTIRIALTDIIDPWLNVFATVSGTTPSFTGLTVDVFESDDSV